MVAVRHGLMSAAGPMHVARRVSSAAMVGGTAVGVARRNLDHVLVDVILMRMMQVPVVQVINVPIVADGHMPAIGPVLMGMMGVVRI